MNQDEKNIKIANPERVNRILQRVAQGGLPVIVRSLTQLDTAVKGRAISTESANHLGGFKIGGLSEKGRHFLGNQSGSGLQIEFVLMATKVVFTTRIVGVDGNSIVVALPSVLTSIERRKDSRYPVSTNYRAYINIQSWCPDQRDPAVLPFFEYQRPNASLLSAGDVSAGGLSIVSRFPAVCKIFQRGSVFDQCTLALPLEAPIPVMLEVRWVKRIRENVQAVDGSIRTTRVYKFGVQFVNPSEQLQTELQRFMAKLAVAEAI